MGRICGCLRDSLGTGGPEPATGDALTLPASLSAFSGRRGTRQSPPHLGFPTGTSQQPRSPCCWVTARPLRRPPPLLASGEAQGASPPPGPRHVAHSPAPICPREHRTRCSFASHACSTLSAWTKRRLTHGCVQVSGVAPPGAAGQAPAAGGPRPESNRDEQAQPLAAAPPGAEGVLKHLCSREPHADTEGKGFLAAAAMMTLPVQGFSLHETKATRAPCTSHTPKRAGSPQYASVSGARSGRCPQ